MTIDFDNWIAGAVAPSTASVEVLPAIPLAERRPVSNRIGLRMVHPDRKGMISAIAFSHDGARIIGSNYIENTIQIWDSQTGEQLVTITTPREPKGAQFWNPNRDFSRLYCVVETNGDFEQVQVDGQYAARISYPDSRMLVFDSTTGELIESIQHSPPTQFSFALMSPGKSWMFTRENLPGTFVGERPQIQRMMNLDTGEWTTLNDEISFPVVDPTESRSVSFIPDESKIFSTGISVREFPSFREQRRIELPPGIHSGNHLLYSSDGKYLVAEYRTYEGKGVFNKWKTTLVCFELDTGKQVGEYAFPYDNDSPQFANKQLSDGTLVFHIWRETPKHAVALHMPDLTPRWRHGLGDYSGVQPGIVSPNGQLTAFICQGKPTMPKADNSIDIDWDLMPQPELKVLGFDGSLLETMILPVGTRTLKFTDDGKSAVIGALASVYKIDLSRPFANEEK